MKKLVEQYQVDQSIGFNWHYKITVKNHFIKYNKDTNGINIEDEILI